jgi:hypothetical protein
MQVPNEDPPPPPKPTVKGLKPAAAAVTGAGTEAGLSLGPFTACPSTTVVAPGSKASVTIGFSAQGSQGYTAKLGIDISERCVSSV